MNWFVAIRHQPVHQIQSFVTRSFRDRFFGIHGFRLLCGCRGAAGELVDGAGEPADAVAAGLETGNANVGPGEADAVPVGVDEEGGDGLGLGVGEGIIFSQ